LELVRTRDIIIREINQGSNSSKHLSPCLRFTHLFRHGDDGILVSFSIY
jgi:hypothetical protein